MRYQLKRRAFTIIEVLVSIAIISLLIALIIPNIDRSLSKNNLSNDVELFKAKLEETRLLAGSTQQIDETDGVAGSTTSDATGYYALLLHKDQNYFSIVKLSYPITEPNNNICKPSAVITQAVARSGECFIERVAFSSGVSGGVAQDFFIAYRTPIQELSQVLKDTTGWTLAAPDFTPPLFKLTYKNKTATVNMDDYTGRVTASYADGN